MIIGSPTATATATAKGKREPLTFNGVEIDRKTGWQTLDLQGDMADMAKSIYEAETVFKEKLMAAIAASNDAKAVKFNPTQHRVILTQNYGKWSATFADKSVKRNTMRVG